MLVVLAAAVAAVMGAEILLQYRVAIKLAYAVDATRLAQLDRAYAPFVEQHLHPLFLFFFPLDPSRRVAIGNDVCRLDADGFREPGLAHAADRKRAFLLGGSAAFGHYASSDRTTITGFLNAAQDEYFFVNAAVPSWNSAQELVRLSQQIVDLNPALVIAYDGANDAVLAELASEHDPSLLPPGTPEHFDRLLEIVADERAIRIERLFPEVMHRIEKYFGRVVEPPYDPEGGGAAARRYIRNHQRMAELSRASGARFLSVFQPVAGLHSNVDPAVVERDPRIAAFHRIVLSQPWQGEFHDFAAIFDGELPLVPMAVHDITDDTIFVDDVHLADRGNAIVARRLLQVIASHAP